MRYDSAGKDFVATVDGPYNAPADQFGLVGAGAVLPVDGVMLVSLRVGIWLKFYIKSAGYMR